MLFLLNTFLAFLVAQLFDVLTRDKTSQASPRKFDIVFFFKDTWQKLLVSLLLSFSISLIVFLNIDDANGLFGTQWQTANDLVYCLIGFAPERLLQFFKKKYSFLQPDQVDDFKRKNP